MYCEVIPIRLFREDAGVLTYSFDHQKFALKPGHIVEIPLGKTKTYGIVSKLVTSVNFKTKPVEKLLYETPLPPHILKSISWLSSYYLAPLPLTAKLFLPQGIGKTRRDKDSKRIFLEHTEATAEYERRLARDDGPSRPRLQENRVSSPASKNSVSELIPLNSAQKTALKEIHAAPTSTKLLHGITGSGKTNIYLKLTEEALKSQKSVILLVPEIALTSQLVQIFKQTFSTQKITLIHSRQTESERHLIWEDILKTDEPQIIIGPRSALLSPVKNLGLIIIDEAHESTYFQENTPKYSALRLASFMANAINAGTPVNPAAKTAKATTATCLFGTATPLAADYYLADKKHAVISLEEKAKTTAIKPHLHVIDLKNRENFTKNRYFSDDLLNAIAENLKNGHQTLIFHNRRGSAPLTICENCGWQALCPNCFLPLTLHADTYELLCHTCGHTCPVFSSCPDCKTPGIIHKGFGTKLLEQELKKLFKSANVIRFDADNKKSETLDQNYSAVKNGDYQIIIGTQTIAKGLDLPLLRTVGVVQADAGLSLPDFSAEEKTFHLLTQVIGRVGRGHLDAAEAFIQTYQPDSPVIKAALDQDYDTFYRHILKNRRSGHFPPFYYLAKISVTYKTEAATLKNVQNLAAALKKSPNVRLAVRQSNQSTSQSKTTTPVEITSPTPAFHEHGSRGYTWQIFLRSPSRAALLTAVKSLPKNPQTHVTLDPPSLLS